MKEPTKADLAAAVAKLTEENAGLRDLLAAVSLAAGTVPVSKDNDYAAEWQRSTRVLAVIKNAADLSDWDGYLAWAAGEVRELAAEPVGYEVYVAFKDAEPEPVITDSERTCGEKNPDGGWRCHKSGAHKTHRDGNGDRWTTDGLFVVAKAAS